MRRSDFAKRYNLLALYRAPLFLPKLQELHFCREHGQQKKSVGREI